MIRSYLRRGSADQAEATASAPRSVRFRDDDHPRFWWHRLHATDYEPAIYATLDEAEWAAMRGWYEETAERQAIGEINVPAMSLIQGLVMGNGLRRIVQLGHFYGYSALLVGFWLRRMGGERRLFSIDIDAEATRFCRDWVKRGGLREQVAFHVGDSADPASADAAIAAIGGAPELVIVDSSHQYGHTLRELDLWIDRMPPNGVMLLHDVSVFAQEFDPTGEGGVRRALDEWVPAHPDVALLSLNGPLPRGSSLDELTYKDGCGIGILQKLPA